MSTVFMPVPKHSTQPAELAMLFARCVRHRREQLGLSVKRAAELSGMETSDWYVLEAGWVPSQDSGLVDADRRNPRVRLYTDLVYRRDQPVQPGTPV